MKIHTMAIISDLQINFDEILKSKTFPEPRLVILESKSEIQGA